MKPLRKHLTREEVNDEEGDMEMADSVADKHTDGNHNYDGSYELHGIKKVGTWTYRSLSKAQYPPRHPKGWARRFCIHSPRPLERGWG